MDKYRQQCEGSSMNVRCMYVQSNTQVKGAWQDHFFDHPTYLNLFEILVPIDGSYFSHSDPEIWHSKIGYLWRNNQKRVK